MARFLNDSRYLPGDTEVKSSTVSSRKFTSVYLSVVVDPVSSDHLCDYRVPSMTAKRKFRRVDYIFTGYDNEYTLNNM